MLNGIFVIMETVSFEIKSLEIKSLENDPFGFSHLNNVQLCI